MYLRYYYRRRHFEEKQFCNLTAGLSLLAIRNSVQMARAKMLTLFFVISTSARKRLTINKNTF